MDEATSHLDIDREHEVNAAVKALKVTRLIVAHRPQTIATADRIAVIFNGSDDQSKPGSGGTGAITTAGSNGFEPAHS